ncbi:MAG: ferritin-like domain-containing protein [Phycisphaeraceae bacterium]|nr:ferritin-like domain-containing protein [Phycisphaeraceae bacterium]
MKLNSLSDLLLDQIRDLHSAETQLVGALPKMAKGAASPELQQLFTEHLKQTRGHVQRLKQAAEILGAKPTGKTCKAMKGLVEEGKEALGEAGEDAVLDVGLVAAAQRVEHYEIAAYGTAVALAERVGNSEVVALLERTLEEEKRADKLLTLVCESSLFEEAPIESENEPARAGR